MPRPPRRKIRPARLRCTNCGQQFIASVPQLGHFVEESPQPVRWVVESTDGVTCPSCRSTNSSEPLEE